MTRSTLLLTESAVQQLLDIRATIAVVRRAFIAAARGQTVMPPKVYLSLPGGSDFRAMPASLQHPAACGIKWVNVHPRNRRRGLPTVMALILLNDPATGYPLAVMDGRLITKLRTAAAAAKTLARPDSHVVGLIGCGAQADAQLAALAIEFRLTAVRAWGARRGEAAAWCRRMRRQWPAIRFQPSPTIQACVRDVDLLVTVTPSRRPLVRRAWVSPGTHLNAVGADAPGKQELDPAILRDAVVVVDERRQAMHGGELNVPIHRRQFHPSQIRGELGEVLIGRVRGRQTASELTVFDSTGVAIHDIAVAAQVWRQAQRQGVGQRITWFNTLAR